MLIIIWTFLHWACNFGLEGLLIIHLNLKTKKQPIAGPRRGTDPGGGGGGGRPVGGGWGIFSRPRPTPLSSLLPLRIQMVSLKS